jgi:hypothetical protein
VLLTGLYPIWFAQSSLAHADIFAAACTLWGLVCILPERDRKPWAAALWFSAAALSKETAIVIPITLAALSLVGAFRATDSPARRRLFAETAWLTSCILPLAAWYCFHYAETGFFFGNPEYLRYNAQANLSPLRFLAAFGHRILHLTAHMNMFVPALMTIAALLLPPRLQADGGERASLSRPALRRIVLLILVNAILFSILGGALLCRYLLPMYPLILLVAVTTFYRRIPYWHLIALFSAAAFLVGLFVNPPYGFAPEDNLAYAHVVRLHLAGINQLERRYPGATVLSAWPMTDELTRPELGYVKQPWDVCKIEDFTQAQIAIAAQEPGDYSAALVFSTKYDPPSPLLSLGAGSEALDERFFGLHHDMPPELIAAELHGTLVWKHDDDGMWVALIRFDRQVEARLERGHAPWLSPGSTR